MSGVPVLDPACRVREAGVNSRETTQKASRNILLTRAMKNHYQTITLKATAEVQQKATSAMNVSCFLEAKTRERGAGQKSLSRNCWAASSLANTTQRDIGQASSGVAQDTRCLNLRGVVVDILHSPSRTHLAPLPNFWPKKASRLQRSG